MVLVHLVEESNEDEELREGGGKGEICLLLHVGHRVTIVSLVVFSRETHRDNLRSYV